MLSFHFKCTGKYHKRFTLAQCDVTLSSHSHLQILLFAMVHMGYVLESCM